MQFVTVWINFFTINQIFFRKQNIFLLSTLMFVNKSTVDIILFSGDQFARLKKGDRYFYDLSGHPGQLSAAQLSEVRRASLARLLCDNTGASQLQPLAFLGPETFNPVISCDDLGAIPRPSLEPWRQSFSSG